ncbi:MAG TPA: hypothetical protein PKL84_00040 [Candidatus Hydrogenedentes bacterium]|nr:hypothetical protein [Candidatus Hydrogenedentota bacterium]
MRSPGHCLFVVCTCALASSPALAHKLNIIAQTDGERIVGSVYYSGGHGAAGIPVHVLGPDGASLGEIVTDKDGGFAFTPQADFDHTFVCESDDGHGAEYTIRAAELPAAMMRPSTSTSASTSISADIERAVARQLQPLRDDLARVEDRARVRDVVGGIGYIVGLMGIVSYFKARARLKGN